MKKSLLLVMLWTINGGIAFGDEPRAGKVSSSGGEHLLQSMLGAYKGQGCDLEVFEVDEDYRFLATGRKGEVFGKFSRAQVLAAVEENARDPEIRNKEEGEVYFAKLQISQGRVVSIRLSQKSMAVFGSSVDCKNLK